MTELTIIASPDEVVRDHQGGLVATVSRSIYWPSPPDFDDFEWPGKKPKLGDKIPVALQYFIAKKKRLAGIR